MKGATYVGLSYYGDSVAGKRLQSVATMARSSNAGTPAVAEISTQNA